MIAAIHARLRRRIGTGAGAGTDLKDQGAILILALIFVTVVGLVGGAIALFASSSLAQTSSLSGDRSQSYAAEAAIQVAIQQVRNLNSYNTAIGYGGGNCSSSTPISQVTVPENGVNGSPVNEQFDVFCSLGQAPLPYERTITFAACLHSTPGSSCLTGQSAYTPKPQAGAVVVGTVTYNDLRNGCSVVTSQTDPCLVPGTSADVPTWDVTKANG